MAAGVIYQTVTTTSGETVELAFYVDDTVTPTTWKPVALPIKTDGTADNTVADLIAAVAGVDHDAAASAVDPVLMGLFAHLTQPVPVSASTDAVRGFGDSDGAFVARTNTNLGSLVDGTASNTDGTVTTVIAASGDAAIKHYLTELEISNTSATGVLVDILSGAVVRRTTYIPGLSLYTKTFNPPLKPNAANETWRFDPASATTTLYCNMSGFKSKV